MQQVVRFSKNLGRLAAFQLGFCIGLSFVGLGMQPAMAIDPCRLALRASCLKLLTS